MCHVDFFLDIIMHETLFEESEGHTEECINYGHTFVSRSDGYPNCDNMNTNSFHSEVSFNIDMSYLDPCKSWADWFFEWVSI